MTTTTSLSTNGELSSSLLTQLNGTRSTDVSAAKEQSDRFLKLLTTQLKNQDPLNPMDNAQMTSQMAQISTVSGIETLNTAMSSLTNQIVQLQALQGAGMVGRSVLMDGNELDVSGGKGTGSYELSANASAVKLEILSPSGTVVGTQQLGTQDKGRHAFEWDASKIANAEGYTFRVTASSNGNAIDTTELMHDTVDAVQTGGSALTLQLRRGGAVAYSQIRSLN